MPSEGRGWPPALGGVEDPSGSLPGEVFDGRWHVAFVDYDTMRSGAGAAIRQWAAGPGADDGAALYCVAPDSPWLRVEGADHVVDEAVPYDAHAILWFDRSRRWAIRAEPARERCIIGAAEDRVLPDLPEVYWLHPCAAVSGWRGVDATDSAETLALLATYRGRFLGQALSPFRRDSIEFLCGHLRGALASRGLAARDDADVIAVVHLLRELGDHLQHAQLADVPRASRRFVHQLQELSGLSPVHDGHLACSPRTLWTLWLERVLADRERMALIAARFRSLGGRVDALVADALALLRRDQPLRPTPLAP